MTKQLPYRFETKLNAFGDTMVYIRQGRRKVWLFSIVNGKIDITVPPNPAGLEAIGLVPNLDGWVSVITK